MVNGRGPGDCDRIGVSKGGEDGFIFVGMEVEVEVMKTQGTNFQRTSTSSVVYPGPYSVHAYLLRYRHRGSGVMVIRIL